MLHYRIHHTQPQATVIIVWYYFNDGYAGYLRKATGSYRTYIIPGKTAALVPEFAVEDLPSAELQPRFLRLQ